MFVLSEGIGYTAKKFSDEFNIPIYRPSDLIIHMQAGSVQIINLVRKELLHGDIAFIRRGSNSEHLMSIVKALELNGVKTINSYAALKLLADKDLTAMVLAKAGYDIPKQMLVSNKDYLHAALAAYKLPIIIKHVTGSQGIGVTIAETKKSALATCESLLGHTPRLILQEYIKGYEERAIVYGSSLLGIVIKEPKKGEFRSNAAKGASFQAIGNIPKKKADALVQINNLLGVTFSAIDYIESEEGDTMSILEVNGSPGIKTFGEATGIDVPAYVREQLLGKEE